MATKSIRHCLLFFWCSQHSWYKGYLFSLFTYLGEAISWRLRSWCGPRLASSRACPLPIDLLWWTSCNLGRLELLAFLFGSIGPSPLSFFLPHFCPNQVPSSLAHGLVIIIWSIHPPHNTPTHPHHPPKKLLVNLNIVSINNFQL